MLRFCFSSGELCDSVFQAIYLSAPGIAANMPPDTITHTALPGGDGTPTIAYAARVTNPFAVTSARSPESVESIRANAPEEAWRAILLAGFGTLFFTNILGSSGVVS